MDDEEIKRFVAKVELNAHFDKYTFDTVKHVFERRTKKKED